MKQNYQTFEISGHGYFCINCNARLTTSYYPCHNCGLTNKEADELASKIYHKEPMPNYPYSQQIYDKVLADWKNIPFEDLVLEGDFISHPLISYRLWRNITNLYPENLVECLNESHSKNLNSILYEEPLAIKRDEEINKKKSNNS